MIHFIIRKNLNNNQWYVRIKAANGLILPHAYNRPADARHAIDLIRTSECTITLDNGKKKKKKLPAKGTRP